MKTFYDYWNNLPEEIKTEYGPGAIVAAKLAWDYAMHQILEEVLDITNEQ